MQVKHLDHLNLSVANFEETAGWYQRMFGFEVVERGIQDGEPWGVIRGGDAMLCIYQRPNWKRYDKDELGEAGQHRIAHFAFRITDRAAWEAVLKRENPKLYYGGINEYPHSTSWYVRDPNGYSIEVALWNNDSPSFQHVLAEA
ncbi:MAG: VOC family protein [Planctomycetes bacterium]|nr:VOC family protein [Planctomycetota bacterium]